MMGMDLEKLGLVPTGELLEAVDGVIARMATGRATACDGLVVGELARRVRAMDQMTEIRIKLPEDGRDEIMRGIVHGPMAAQESNARNPVNRSPDGVSGHGLVARRAESRCDACGGVGQVEDGHHGHGVRCERCEGRGTR
jgi:hypothetical protein